MESFKETQSGQWKITDVSAPTHTPFFFLAEYPFWHSMQEEDKSELLCPIANGSPIPLDTHMTCIRVNLKRWAVVAYRQKQHNWSQKHVQMSQA